MGTGPRIPGEARLRLPRPGPEGVEAFFGGDVAQVPVRGGQAVVAELVADEVDRLSLSGQFGGMGVAQAVGVDPFVDPGPFGQAGEEAADVAGVEGLAGEGAEE